MTIYAKIENDVVITYPYSFTALREDNPNVSFPRNMSEEQYAEWGVLPVSVEETPTVDSRLQKVIAAEPVLVDGAWTQGWTITDLDAEDAEENFSNYRKQLTCTMRQARLALLQQNKLADIDNVIAALPDGERKAAEIQWEYGSTVERLSPLVVSLISALGLTDETMDDLFELAKTL